MYWRLGIVALVMVVASGCLQDPEKAYEDQQVAKARKTRLLSGEQEDVIRQEAAREYKLKAFDREHLRTTPKQYDEKMAKYWARKKSSP